MIYFSIKELENFSGIKAHTIRTWEQRFSFLQPRRSDKLRRTYSLDELKLILDISVLNRNGYKVSHIAKMDKMDIRFTLCSLSSVEQKREKAINELITFMAAMDAEGFEMVLDRCLLSWGIHDTITHIIIPFTQKAGMLQQVTNRFYKPNLLVVEQSIKQKIIVGIEKTVPVKEGKKALFFLSKKTCELELLYIQYTLKTKGFSTLFINNFTSLQNLEIIATAYKPDYIITALANKPQQFSIDSFLRFLVKRLADATFFNLGRSIVTAGLKDNSKIRQSEQVMELLEMILMTDAVAIVENN